MENQNKEPTFKIPDDLELDNYSYKRKHFRITNSSVIFFCIDRKNCPKVKITVSLTELEKIINMSKNYKYFIDYRHKCKLKKSQINIIEKSLEDKGQNVEGNEEKRNE